MSVAIERAQARDPNLWRINLVGLWTIVRKETRRVVRIWIQTIVPPAITMTLYFIIFGSLVGSRIGSMDGVPYMTFIAPGLITMTGGLPVIDYARNVMTSPDATRRCPTGAIAWVEGAQRFNRNERVGVLQ